MLFATELMLAFPVLLATLFPFPELLDGKALKDAVVVVVVVRWCTSCCCAPVDTFDCPEVEKLCTWFDVGPSSKCKVGGAGNGSVFISTGERTGEVTSSDSILMWDWEPNMSAFSGSSFWMLDVMSSQRGGLRKTSSSFPPGWLLEDTKLACGLQTGPPTSKKSSICTEDSLVSLSPSSSSNFCKRSRSCLQRNVSRSDVCWKHS